MNSNKKVKGAVSVFLVLILVPCILVSSVFVDLGRVHMSKSMATSAGDLALNSLMTNYDADLSEWYGMVASCQNIEEFYQISAQFFLRTLSSSGLSDNELILVSDYYSKLVGDDTIYDFLQVESLTDPGEMISSISDANLSNATMLKDQVVEFMKYRAPIELTAGIIEKLKNDPSVDSALDCEENKPLVDDKMDYYTAEGELLAAAFNSCVAIWNYHMEAQKNGLTNDKLNDYAETLTQYQNAYMEIHELYVSNLSNTDKLSRYTRVALPLDQYNKTYTEKSKEVYSRKETQDDVTHYYIDGEDITDLLDALEKKIEDFYTVKESFEKAASSLMGKLPGTGANQSHAVQWWVQMNQAVNSSSGHTKKMKDAAQNLLKAYSKVLAIKKCELGDDIPDDWEHRFDHLTEWVEEIQEKYLKAGVTDSKDAYLNAVKKLEDVSKANYDKISADHLTVTVDGQSMTLSKAIAHIQSKMSAMHDELQEYIDLLTVAIDGNEYDWSIPKNERVKKLDDLLSLAENYDKTFDAWTATAKATDPDNKMGQADIKEIEKINNDYGEINKESVNELKTRLKNIRSQLKNVVECIESMRYGGVKLLDLTTLKDLKAGAQKKVSTSKIGLTNQQVENYAKTTFGQLFTPNTTPVLTLSHLNDVDYNPNMNPLDAKTPKLFVYLFARFSPFTDKKVEQVREKQDELDGGKGMGSKKSDDAKDKGRYHGAGEEIQKEFSGDQTFNILDGAISGALELFESLMNLDVTNIRDDLYVTSYMMNMFTYATYENEGLYGLVEDKKELTLSSYPTEYEKVKGKLPTEEHTWLSASNKDFYNKSLTNKMLNQTNNAAYCAEVEYILFGGRDGKGNADNVKAVYNNIFAIRYALNVVSGFANFWSSQQNSDNITASVINSIAGAIAGLTQNIVPAEVTKVVLIPILTAFETAKDLERLEAGFPVELYKKGYEQWWIRVPQIESDDPGVGDFTATLSNPFDGPNTDEGLFYSDYLTVFVYLGLESGAAEDMYQRMAEVIQANIRRLSGNDSYSMREAQVYFKLEATLRVKPLMLALPIFNDYKDEMDPDSDWCTYKITTVRGYS